ncbi:hypothetical protein BDB01DRAFT_773964 [Pilobolus umbonatus]|nr:hypothetical protein BDB01DRAFT_773964 [Pilobolus umbonatus]
MPQLDPFIIYTVKLAMDYKSLEQYKSTNMIETNNENSNILYPEAMSRIMTIKTWSHLNEGHTPKLSKDNILSLLYYADKQWVKSTIDLNKMIDKNNQDTHPVEDAVEHVHRQQQIYFDTLHLLHNIVLPNKTQPRFNEPIWFAAQVLHSQCQIRHLESFTDQLYPLASYLYESLDNLRVKILCVVQQQQHELSHLSKKNKNESLFRSIMSSISNIYKNKDTNPSQLLSILTPHLTVFLRHWIRFEKALYECYVQTVFGKRHRCLIVERNNPKQSISHREMQFNKIQNNLPAQLFHDTFTQLLPLTLERAINLNIISVGVIQSLDPIGFVAIPRLAILAGVTWLSHLTGWRRINHDTLPIWLSSQQDHLIKIIHSLNQLESILLQTPSEDAPHTFVKTYHSLEQALVSGRSDGSPDLEKDIFIYICTMADSILTSIHAQSFNVVLWHLFKHFGLQFDNDMEEEDAVLIEECIMRLSI